tara:strand:- start:41 stop:610 length:570 start_codon:yes stop_codon:yes gene_type:complete
MLLNKFNFEKVNNLLISMRNEAEKIIQNNSEKKEFIEERFAFMRYAGQGHEIKVHIDNDVLSNEDAKKIKNSFEENYEKLYSRILPNADIEILTWSLSLSIMGENTTEYLELDSYKKIRENSLIDFCDYESGEKIKIPNYERTKLNPGDLINGQCVITEAQTTIVVSNNFNTKVLSNNFLQMEYIDNER